MSIAIVTGSITPYMNRLYEAFADASGADLHVYQCAKLEPMRQWSTPPPTGYALKTLPGLRYHRSEISHIYVNPSILTELARLKPETVIICSFSPTMVLAALYAIKAGASLGLGIEGSREIDPGETSAIHRWIRRGIAPHASFGLCSSRGAREMMEHWGLPKGAGFMVPHSGTWDAPGHLPGLDERPFDLLLCGSLNDRKNPLFFADVAERLAHMGHKLRVRVVGDGPLREPLRQRLSAAGISLRFDGYLQQEQIVEAYLTSKLLLFPTLTDSWGLVANEALLCGTPVVCSPHALSSRELVHEFGTGLMLDLDPEQWARQCDAILSSPELWASFQRRRAQAMSWFSLSSSVEGMVRAVEHGRARMKPDSQPTRLDRARELSRTP